MIKLLDRAEVLKRVRITNKYYSPFQSLIYKSTAPKYFGDLEIIRYNRQDWIEVQRIGNDVYFKTLEDFMNSIQLCLMIIIDVEDLQHLTDCGYGFLKGCDKDE